MKRKKILNVKKRVIVERTKNRIDSVFKLICCGKGKVRVWDKGRVFRDGYVIVSYKV